MSYKWKNDSFLSRPKEKKKSLFISFSRTGLQQENIVINVSGVQRHKVFAVYFLPSVPSDNFQDPKMEPSPWKCNGISLYISLIRM